MIANQQEHIARMNSENKKKEEMLALDEAKKERIRKKRIDAVLLLQ